MKLRLIFLSQIGCPFMVTIQCFFHQPMATNQKKKEIMQNNLENVANSQH